MRIAAHAYTHSNIQFECIDEQIKKRRIQTVITQTRWPLLLSANKFISFRSEIAAKSIKIIVTNRKYIFIPKKCFWHDSSEIEFEYVRWPKDNFCCAWEHSRWKRQHFATMER